MIAGGLSISRTAALIGVSQSPLNLKLNNKKNKFFLF
jgi:hypothetical protein